MFSVQNLKEKQHRPTGLAEYCFFTNDISVLSKFYLSLTKAELQEQVPLNQEEGLGTQETIPGDVSWAVQNWTSMLRRKVKANSKRHPPKLLDCSPHFHFTLVLNWYHTTQ